MPYCRDGEGLEEWSGGYPRLLSTVRIIDVIVDAESHDLFYAVAVNGDPLKSPGHRRMWRRIASFAAGLLKDHTRNLGWDPQPLT